MDTPRRWIQYDTYKLIVALILLVVFILLLLQKRPVPAQTGETAATPVSQAAAPTAPTVSTATPVPAVQPAASPTSLPLPSPTVPPLPQPTATPVQAAQPTTAVQTTAAPAATTPPTTEASPTPSTENAAVDCPKALPARLSVGMQARITTNLNLRTSPEIGNNLIRTNPGSTQLEVIGGPVCTPYKGGAYLWWNVQLPDGTAGWSAEGSLTGKFYFLEPIS